MAQLGVFTRGLTAQKIVAAADLDAGSPGLYLTSAGAETLDAPAYVRLQALLNHLAQTRAWPSLYDVLTIAVSTRTTALPSDFWRAMQPTFWILDPITAVRRPLQVVSVEEFHALIHPSNTMTGTPSLACVMKNRGAAQGGSAAGAFIVEPAPDQSYQVEIHYMPQPIQLAAITSVPWFPHSLYLVKAVAVELFLNQDDPRRSDVAATRDQLMREIVRSERDVGAGATQIRHAPLCFRPTIRI
jgi:hypothetical protein